ncbi:MAG TPA: DnaA/Hda family protein [Pirellulales bacterium]|nr:DnaA/Hda family protein [Pirellulales bacterium]
MSKDDMEIVSALNLALAEKVGAQRFDLWFKGHTELSLAGDALLVKVPSTFLQDFLRKTFRREIELACFETLERAISVSFQVDPQLAQAPQSAEATTVSLRPREAAECGSQTAVLPPAKLRAIGVDESDHTAETAGVKAHGDESPRRRRFSTLDTFAVGASNRLAHVSICDVVEGHGRTNPLVIHGATGVGKTHLLEGLWTAVRRRRPSAEAVYLSAEQFTNYFLGALHGTGLPNFRRKYRGLELLIIDDLQFFENKRATRVELLYTVDTLLREHRQIVFAADRPLEQLGELGPELIARLQGGMVCAIDSPDFETRLGVVERMCRQLHIDASPEVQALVAGRVTTHARALAGALKRVRAASLAHAQPITPALALEALVDIAGSQTRDVRLSDIETATCSVFGLEPKALRAGGVAKRVNYPRMLAMWLARKHTRSALSEIGQYFGRRSHSTVISAEKKINALRLTPQSEGQPSVQETIRRVEEALRVG